MLLCAVCPFLPFVKFVKPCSEIDRTEKITVLINIEIVVHEIGMDYY